MLELNVDTGNIVYSSFERDPKSGQNYKKYFLKNEVFLEKNVTTFPIKYDNGYIYSYSNDGMKFCYYKNKSFTLYDNISDNFIMKSNKNNDISNHYQSYIPMIYNGNLGLLDYKNERIKSYKIDDDILISTKSIKINDNEFYFYLFDKCFYIVRNGFDKVLKLSTGNKLKRLEIGKVSSDEFSIMVVDSIRTGIFSFSLLLNLSKKQFYNVSYESTIDEDNILYWIDNNEYNIVSNTERKVYKANKKLPSAISKIENSIIFIDETDKLVVPKTIGSKFIFKDYVFSRTLIDIVQYKNYDLNYEYVVATSNLHKLKNIEVVNSLYN